MEGCSCARKRPVEFWTLHTFVCKANQPELLLKIVRGKKYREMYGKYGNYFHSQSNVVPWQFAQTIDWILVWAGVGVETLGAEFPKQCQDIAKAGKDG